MWELVRSLSTINQTYLLKHKIRLAENNDELSSKIIKVHEIEKQAAGKYPYLKIPYKSTVKLYQVLNVEDNQDVHLVRYGKRKRKVNINSRQITSISDRNLPSHITAVTYANYMPIAGKWNIFKQLPRGRTLYK